MFVEVVLALLMVGVYWYYHLRMPKYVPVRTVTVEQAASGAPAAGRAGEPWDYVVVGAGAAGAAAVRTLLYKDPAATVLLIDRGRDTVGGRTLLPAFVTDLVNTDIDMGVRCVRPLQSADSTALQDEALGPHRSTSSSLPPYPTGKCFGGTQLLSWGLVLSPTPHLRQRCCGEAHRFALGLYENLRKQFSSLPVFRSPLSWAFAESAKSRVPAFLPSVDQVTNAVGDILPLLCLDHVAIHPVWLDSTRYGSRPNLAHCLLDDALKTPTQRHNVAFLGGTAVLQLDGGDGEGNEGARWVRAVVCRSPLGGVVRIRFRKAVVCCSGAVASHQLLRELVPREWPSAFCDTVAVPLLYECNPGLSDDARNSQTMKQIFAWYAARRGALLNAFADTSVLLQSKVHPGASLLITLIPSGGYSRTRFQKLGLSRSLGLFSEGLTFNIALHTLPGCEGKLPSFGIGNVAVRKTAAGSLTAAESSPVSDVTLSAIGPAHEGLRSTICDLLVEGIRFCREVVSCAPLSRLSSQREALDTTLMSPEDGKLIFNALYAASRGKRGRSAKSGPPPNATLLAKARDRALAVANSDDYLTKYVTTHACYQGFVSGTLSDALERGCLRLHGYRNVFVGDSSVVPPAVALEDGIHIAGSVSTAIVCGSVAAWEAASQAEDASTR